MEFVLEKTDCKDAVLEARIWIWIGNMDWEMVATKSNVIHEFQRTLSTVIQLARYTRSERRSSVRTVTSRRVFERLVEE